MNIEILNSRTYILLGAVAAVFAGYSAWQGDYSYLLGSLLGVGAAVVYGLQLSKRVEKAIDMEPALAVMHMRIGMMMRMLLTAAVVMIAILLDFVDEYSTIISFFVANAIIFANIIFEAYRISAQDNIKRRR